VFIDVYAGDPSDEKRRVADKLGIRIAPGHYSLLVSKDRRRVRRERRSTDFVAARPKNKQEMNSLLTDTYYDFMIVEFSLGKRNIRMAKRYETAVAIPVAPAFSLKVSDLARVRKNMMLVQELGGTLLICSGAGDASQLRGGRELAAMGILLGLRPDYATRAVKHVPVAILERNRRRAKQEVWGVEE